MKRRMRPEYDEFGKLNFYQSAQSWMTPPLYGPFYLDDGDDGAGGGNGGGDDAAAKAAADAAADAAAATAKTKDPETYEIKVDGEIKHMTLEEMKELASKAGGADERFREASKLREEAKVGVELKKAFEKINSGEFDESDVRKLAELTGQDPDEAATIFKTEKAKAKGTTSTTPKQKIALEDLPDDIRQIIETAKQDQISAAEREINNIVRSAVDKDEILGKIMVDASEGKTEEERKGLQEAVASMVQRDVRAKILASPHTREKFGTEMIRNSIQTIRAEVKKLGIPTKANKDASKTSILAALGAASGLPAEVYTDDSVERVSSDDPDYHDNAVKRLGQAIRKGLSR